METITLENTVANEVGQKQPDIITAYCFAKKIAINAGYGAEINWQASLNFDDLVETDFLREYAWVVLSTGMHEYIIRRFFPVISHCFCDWQSAKIIVKQEDKCRHHALRHFNNHRKIDAIIETACIIDLSGFDMYKGSIRHSPLEALQSLPFIGPVTRYHLAKNIGLPFAKPDRHLVRLANSVGYSDVQQFCKDISEYANDTIPVVDIVLWRFAAITNSYLNIFYDAASKAQRK